MSQSRSGSPRAKSSGRGKATTRSSSAGARAMTRPGAKKLRSPQAKAKPTTLKNKPRTYGKGLQFPLARSSVRIKIFAGLISLTLLIAGGRAVQLQGFDSSAFAAQASAKMQKTRELPAKRGDLLDRNGAVLATTRPAVLVSIDPEMIRTNGADPRYEPSARKKEEMAAAPEAVAMILTKHLGGRKQDYLDAIARPNSHYEVVARKVPSYVFSQIQADLSLGIDGDGKRPWYGVFSANDPVRDYPNRTVASNVIGFVNGEGEGASGLEYSLDSQLKGVVGSEVYDRSTYGRIPLGTSVMTPAIDGMTYRTTIDADLQWSAEQIVANAVRNAGALTGTAVIMDVKSGEILALVNNPSFDAANPGTAKTADLGNRAVTATYEPGSVQKVLTAAALTDAGLVTPDTKVVVPPRIASGGKFVGDAWDHGTLKLTARGIMANSSNVGTIELARQMEKATLTKYLKSFGLGATSGSGMPGEASGAIPGPDMADYTRDQISFGQGLSVNAVQMAAAVAAVINGGTYHQPRILLSGTKADGSAAELPQSTSRRVISPESSAMVRDMMEAVITMAKDRSIPGYRTIGKSGTAQRFDNNCKCYSGYTASFVGAAPAEDPQILVYVVIDKPTRGSAGSQLALPVVNDLLLLALPRFNVPPSATSAPNLPLTFE